MLAKMVVPANSKVVLVTATIGVARGDGKEKWDSDSDASFHMYHTQARITSYKKVPAGTTVEVTDGTTLPVDGFGTIEMDLDQLSIETKPVKMVSVAIVPGFSRNLLSTHQAVNHRRNSYWTVFHYHFYIHEL